MVDRTARACHRPAVIDLQPPPPSLLHGASLFLDFDGTLVELAERPDAIQVPPTLPDLLVRLADRLDGRLAIVSGRALADLDRHLPCAASLYACGSHGAEFRLPNQALSFSGDASAGLATLREAANAFGKERPGVLVEHKPAGLALHFRQAPAAGAEAARFAETWAQRSGLALQHGKCVVELRPAGLDKGTAVRRIMREPPFADARPVFVGDDLTDEHAFDAADSLGGAGVLVGAVRTTAARWRLPDVSAVAAWLQRAAR